MYYKLKTSFLEETLSDALEDDSFDLSILDSSSQTDTGGSFSISEMSTVDISLLTNSTFSMLTDLSNGPNSSTASTSSELPLNKTLAESITIRTTAHDNKKNGGKEFEAEKYEALNDQAWGAHLNNEVKRSSSDDKNAERSAKVRQTMSDKLFRNSSFAKRNPRKSLSTNSLRSSNSFSSITDSQKESLPDLETILSQKSQQGDGESSASVGKSIAVANTGALHSNIHNHINAEWLNRCNQANSLRETDVSVSGVIESRTPQQGSAEERPKYGLSNINASALVNPKEISLSSLVGNKTMLSFDMSNLNIERGSGSFATENKYGHSDDDDDDEIANSEEENSANNGEPKIRSIRHVMKKRKLDELAAESQILKSVNIETITNTPAEVDQAEVKTKKKIQKKTRKVVKKNLQPAPPKRRSARVPKTAQETKYNFDSDGSNEEEVDPFAADDTDDDPDFGSGKMGQIKPTNEQVESSPSSDESEQVKEKPMKRVARKVVKVLKKVVPKRATKSKAVSAKKGKDDDHGDEPIENEETPDDYQIEFGLDKIKSIPRIDIAELEQTTEVFFEYVVKQTTMSDGPVRPSRKGDKAATNTKQSIARDKLEKRVAAGTLNENFVRINLRKKVFVRGKKTTNFSKYKKAQWRQKKAAALAGPDMDMGGCDGGILICFQCGQSGHFAQNCKIKSKTS